MDSRKEATLELLVSARHEAMSVGVRHKFYDNTDSGTWWKYNQSRAKYFNRYKLLPNTRNTWDLEIFRAWFSGLRVWLSAPVISWMPTCHMRVSSVRMTSDLVLTSDVILPLICPEPGLITDNWLEPDIHISIVFTLSGPGPIKHDELLRKLGTQYTDIRAHGSYSSSRAGALLTLLSLDLYKLQASVWSCYTGLQMRFGREWGRVRGLVTSNNNHNWNVGAILVHICPK